MSGPRRVAGPRSAGPRRVAGLRRVTSNCVHVVLNKT